MQRARQENIVDEETVQFRKVVIDRFRNILGQCSGIIANAFKMVSRFGIAGFREFGHRKDNDVAGFHIYYSFARPYPDCKLFSDERFLDEIVRACVHAFHDISHIAFRSDHDNVGVFASLGFSN